MADPILGNIQLQLRAGRVVRPALTLGAPLYWRSGAPASDPGGRISARGIISGGLAAAGSLSTTKGSSSLLFNAPGASPTPPLADTTTGALPAKQFVSDPLATQSIPAQLWTMASAGQSGYASPVVGFSLALGVWRPSTSALVGLLYDGTSIIGSTLANNATTGAVGRFGGASIDVEDDDVLVLEVYHAVQAGSYFAPGVGVYNGANAITDASIGANGDASFIQPSHALAFL